MLLRFILVLILSVFVRVILAQNLVPNPSFEEYRQNCFIESGLANWFSPNESTPDYYCILNDQCGTYLDDSFIEDYQIVPPSDGACMIGLFCMMAEGTEQSRDYWTVRLSEHLEQGESYSISISIVRAAVYNLAINNIGVAFTTDSINVESYTFLNLNPQIVTSDYLINSTEWQNLSFNYTASGDEYYLTIGCFADYSNENVMNTQTSWKNWDNAYYYIDNICLSSDSLFCVNFSSSVEENRTQDQFAIYPNPTTDFITIQNSSDSAFDLSIYNSLGNLLYREEDLNLTDYKLDLRPYGNGLLILKLTSAQEELTYKVLKTGE